jgi:hypothetical protein
MVAMAQVFYFRVVTPSNQGAARGAAQIPSHMRTGAGDLARRPPHLVG